LKKKKTRGQAFSLSERGKDGERRFPRTEGEVGKGEVQIPLRLTGGGERKPRNWRTLYQKKGRSRRGKEIIRAQRKGKDTKRLKKKDRKKRKVHKTGFRI